MTPSRSPSRRRSKAVYADRAGLRVGAVAFVNGGYLACERSGSPGQEPSFPRRSEFKSRTADERRVSGDESGSLYGSARPSAASGDRQLPGIPSHRGRCRSNRKMAPSTGSLGGKALVEEQGSAYMADKDGDSDETVMLRPSQAAASVCRIAFDPGAGASAGWEPGTSRDITRGTPSAPVQQVLQLQQVQHHGAAGRRPATVLCCGATGPFLLL